VRRSRTTDNRSRSSARAGEAGATNGIAVYDFSDNPRQVTIADTVTSNNRSIAISKHGSAVVYGGGMYTKVPVVQHRSVIQGNHPDTCFGC
jgi:hypothetical protein